MEITTHKKRYISPEERQHIIDELTLVPKNYWCQQNSMYLKILIALQYIKTEYQKMANLLDNVLNEPSKFKTRNWLK